MALMALRALRVITEAAPAQTQARTTRTAGIARRPNLALRHSRMGASRTGAAVEAEANTITARATRQVLPSEREKAHG